MRDFTDLLGRIFLSAIFLFEAFDTALYADKTRETMSRYGVTWNQDLLVVAAAVFLIIGGLMVLLGYRPGLGAAMLLIYWIPVTFIAHDFWNFPKEQLRMQSILFMRNIAIAGGLMMYGAKDSGRYSIKRLLATTRV
jgi:putative oxidoreductase